MSEPQLPKSRRKLLKSIALGGGAIAVSKTLPESWTKPVIDSVILPAHAQASCAIDPITNTTNDGVGINFSGDSCSASTYIGDGHYDIQSANTMLYIDNDSGASTPHFDLKGPTYGSNWGDGPDVNSLLAGTHSYTMARVGGVNSGKSYQITFTVALSNPDMTVSDISFLEV